MNIRNSVSVLGFAIAIGAPLAALAGGFWELTNDEAGSRIVSPQVGAARMGPMHAGGMRSETTPLQVGDISTDRQYVFLGEEGGWQLRPMQYRVQDGGFAHVDDPVGHMHRVADNAPPTARDRANLERSGGG